MASRWSRLSGRELVGQAWWRPLPGIVIGAVALGVIVNPVLGALVGVLAWVATIAFNALLVGETPSGPFHRRHWR